jgi:hypothetical protein
MSTLSPKDRVSLCSFTFSDGRHCRTPRLRDNSRFCPYHAEKEARARAAQKLGKDLDYFFSGDYLSACDLSTALGRLIPAVVRGEVKPRAARTVAYLAQTLMQAIHLSKHEYINAFGTDGWRQSIRNSVKYNQDYLFPPAPEAEQPAPSALRETLRNEPSASPQQSSSTQPQPAYPQARPPASPSAQTPANCHSERSEESAFSSSSAQPTPAPQPVPSPHTSLPPTSAEFAQHLLAGRNLSRPAPETGGDRSPQPAQMPPSQPAEAPLNCHPERSEGSASSSSSPLVTHHSPLPQVQQSEIPTLSEPASAPPSTPPQPAAQPIPAPPSTPPQSTPVTQPFRSLALPLPVRRRLHRAPV